MLQNMDEWEAVHGEGCRQGCDEDTSASAATTFVEIGYINASGDYIIYVQGNPKLLGNKALEVIYNFWTLPPIPY